MLNGERGTVRDVKRCGVCDKVKNNVKFCCMSWDRGHFSGFYEVIKWNNLKINICVRRWFSG